MKFKIGDPVRPVLNRQRTQKGIETKYIDYDCWIVAIHKIDPDFFLVYDPTMPDQIPDIWYYINDLIPGGPAAIESRWQSEWAEMQDAVQYWRDWFNGLDK